MTQAHNTRLRMYLSHIQMSHSLLLSRVYLLTKKIGHCFYSVLWIIVFFCRKSDETLVWKWFAIFLASHLGPKPVASQWHSGLRLATTWAWPVLCLHGIIQHFLHVLQLRSFSALRVAPLEKRFNDLLLARAYQTHWTIIRKSLLTLCFFSIM